MSAEYTEDNIKSLDWKEHIRLRPGMYILVNWAMVAPLMMEFIS